MPDDADTVIDVVPEQENNDAEDSDLEDLQEIWERISTRLMSDETWQNLLSLEGFECMIDSSCVDLFNPELDYDDLENEVIDLDHLIEELNENFANPKFVTTYEFTMYVNIMNLLCEVESDLATYINNQKQYQAPVQIQLTKGIKSINNELFTALLAKCPC